MDPATAWIFCLVLAHFIQKWMQGAYAQAGAEARRARDQWAGQIRDRMDTALATAGPGSSPWWWAGAARRTWRGMRGPRPGSSPRVLPHASPWRRIAAAGWAHGRAAARARWRAPRPARSRPGGGAGPRSRPQPGPRSRPRSRVAVAACDRCNAVVAKASLQPVPVQAGDRTELWLMCVACAAAAARSSAGRDQDPAPAPDPGPGTWDLGPEDSWEQDDPAALDPAPDPPGPDDGWAFSYGLAGRRIHTPAGNRTEADTQARGLSRYHERPMVVCAYPPGDPQPGQVIAAYQHGQPQDPAAVEAAWPLEIDPAETAGQPAEGEDMTGTDLAQQGGESYTHGQWEQVTRQIAQALDELGPALEHMLGSLNAADAGRSQVDGVMTLYDQTVTWAGQVRAMLTEVTGREAPVVEAVGAAGGPEEIAGIDYYSEL